MQTVHEITDIKLAEPLHQILFTAFLPYRKYYTPEAFAATVCSAEVFQQRILSMDFTVYGAYTDNLLAGTATSKVTERGDLYFMTMAVDPKYAGRGLGHRLLQCLEEEARKKQCPHLLLETYYPLAQAIHLYTRAGFTRTGNKRDYAGIEIFEMMKEL